MAIVVGYIPNERGDAALDRAIGEAAAHGDRLVVLNAARGDTAIEARRLSEPGAADLELKLADRGVEFEIRQLTETGDAAEVIVRVAEEIGAHMIVIGVRRRSPVGKLVLGSTAQRVLLDAPCPVLAVKAPGAGR